MSLEVTVVWGLWPERKWPSKGHTVSIQLPWRPALDPYCLVVLSNLICLNIPVSQAYICWINLSWTESWSIFAEHSNLRAAEQELAAELVERSRTVFIKTLRVRKLNRIEKVNIWCSFQANLCNLCTCQVGLAHNLFLISDFSNKIFPNVCNYLDLFPVMNILWFSKGIHTKVFTHAWLVMLGLNVPCMMCRKAQTQIKALDHTCAEHKKCDFCWIHFQLHIASFNLYIRSLLTLSSDVVFTFLCNFFCIKLCCFTSVQIILEMKVFFCCLICVVLLPTESFFIPFELLILWVLWS